MKEEATKLKIGIAGFGIVGRRRKAAIDARPEMKVVAVCDKNLMDKSKLEDGVICFSNYKDLLNEPLDALFVCLTNEIAPEVTIAGLESGLHVFCEKPPGRTPAEVLSVINAERSSPRLKLMYGFNHRHHDSVKDALGIARSGELGNIISLRGVYGKSRLITFDQPDWRTKREIAGGGVLLDQGIHMVDLMRLFAGEFCDVHSFISNGHWNYEVEDNAYAIMRTHTGVVGMLHSSATQWRHTFNLDINLEKGSIILGGILSGTKSYGAETLTVAVVDQTKNNGDPKEQITKYNNDPSWAEEVELFAKAILRDEPIKSGTSEDAMRTMSLVYKIYYADKDWRNKFLIDDPDAVADQK